MKFLATLFLAAMVFVCAPDFAAAENALSKRQMLSASEQSQWSAIGRLNITGLGFCTGTLIGPDQVLTAAHCVVDKRTGRVVLPERVHFLAGFRAGSFVAHGVGAEIVLMPGYSRSKKSVGSDLAIVRLTAPLPGTVRPIESGAVLEPRRGLDTLSYGLDRAQIASIERNCRYKNRVGTVIYTTCDGVPGVSGAPILQMENGQPRIVAVASAVLPAQRAPMPKGAVLAVDAGASQLQILHRQLRGAQLAGLAPMARPQPREGS
ncbi:MAG: trypsin-like serine protease [Rhodobacteraceae bacterium]|nr:trypsin-like serine protease [Paracoccaceae bacterium]